MTFDWLAADAGALCPRAQLFDFIFDRTDFLDAAREWLWHRCQIVEADEVFISHLENRIGSGRRPVVNAWRHSPRYHDRIGRDPPVIGHILIRGMQKASVI